jgi:hypothetical protein
MELGRKKRENGRRHGELSDQAYGREGAVRESLLARKLRIGMLP